MCSTPAAVYGSVASMSTLRNITGKVVDCSQETADTWTLHIDVAAADRQYEAGQFISIDPHLESLVDCLRAVGKRQVEASKNIYQIFQKLSILLRFFTALFW